jgi:SAM-dependent methyltransferase
MEALIGRIGGDELFLLLLEKTINTDPDLENLLTDIRRVLLFKYGAAPGLTPGEAQVAYALACQCLNNEYVFAQDEGEGARVAVLKEAIERRVPVLSAADAELERDLVVYGMYDRLCSLSCREALHAISRDGWSEGFQGLLEQALLNPLEEDKIKAAIPTLGRLEDTTTRLVRSQYEENPYPRWISVPQLKKRNIKRVLKQLFPRFSPPDFLDSPIQFLVAGCGTGQHPIITSLTFDNVDITAVDISKSSLAYAIRMARGYGVKNIHFMQGDILELGELGRQFHIIESTGVLHHMEDPLAGWKVLTDLLIDDGLMSIGLYSEKARQHIVAARELIAREHLPSDTTSIRNLRTRIFRRELGDLLYSLTSSKDFYSTSGCRDLIFHSREHRFTLPQLDKAIQSLGLDFIGFEFEDTRVNSRYQEMFPTDEYMTNLTLWDHFEDNYPHTFARMYNFWCQKKR